MLKQLLHDFYMTMDSEYQPTTFKPYLKMILSIVFLTIVGFSIQTTTTSLRTYAADPASMKTEIKKQETTCTDFSGQFYFYLCQGLKQEPQTVTPTVNQFLEHDLHSVAN